MPVVLERVRVVVDDDVMSGEPCIEGTRVPAQTIILNIRAGHSIARIYEGYPTLPKGAVEAALDWAESEGIDWRGEWTPTSSS